MKKYTNGKIVEMTPEEIGNVQSERRAQMLRERSRPLTAEEVLEKIAPAIINSVAVDDNTALRMVEYYPEWAAGMVCPVGHKVRRGGRLWRVLQAHTAQVGWEPENAASLWTEVCESHDGSEDDPIPYNGNMALVAGLYYVQDYVVYRCIRDTGNPVHHRLEELVGLYVEAA